MRRIVHLSDLHFGRVRPELVDPLLAAVSAARPDLVAISGDLTQRARGWQFAEARAFLDRLDAPWISVPGNHDVPLDNLAARLLRPWAGYRRWIDADLAPRWSDDETTVVGLNTVNPFDWQRGRARSGQVAKACAAFAEAGRDRVNVLIAHHPFEQLPEEPKALMRGAAKAVGVLGASGVDVVLSGHLHAWRAHFARAAGGSTGVVQVLAGTGLSSRVRGEPNDFNLLLLEKNRILVERHAAGDSDSFSFIRRATFLRRGGGWEAADDDVG